jgi:CheY-like chemotaxis protein
VQKSGLEIAASGESCKCAKVLIADDEPFNLIALEGLLHQFNVGSVDKAYHGKEALAKIESNLKDGNRSCGSQHRPYKLIMLDKNMPVMDGVDAGMILKRWEREGKI